MVRSFNGDRLFTILTDSTLTHTIALYEVKDVARSLDWSLGLLVVPLCFMFVAGEAIAKVKSADMTNMT